MEKKDSDSLGALMERRSKPTLVSVLLSILPLIRALIDTKLIAFPVPFFIRNHLMDIMSPFLDKRSPSFLKKDLRGQPLLKSKKKRGVSLLARLPSKMRGSGRWVQ